MFGKRSKHRIKRRPKANRRSGGTRLPSLENLESRIALTGMSLIGRIDGTWIHSQETEAGVSTTNWATWSNQVEWLDTVFADFDGDGEEDIASRGNGEWWISRESETGTQTEKWGAWANINWLDVQAADINGDSLADIVGRTQSGAWWAAISNGESFTNQKLGVWSSSVNWNNVAVLDANGDGRDDMVSHANGSLWVAESTGSNYETRSWGGWSANAGWQDLQPIDVNGDGMSDVVGRTSNGSWWVAVSNGESFDNAKWGQWSTKVSWDDVLVADFNDDGNQDIAGRANGNWWVGASDGNKFTTSRWGSWSNNVPWTNVTAADFNGDGKDDIIGRVHRSWWLAESSGETFTNRLWSTWEKTNIQDPSAIGLQLSTANFPPKIIDQTFAIDENSATDSVVGTVVATDPNDDPLIYSIVGGTGVSAFNLDNTGQLTVKSSSLLDHEQASSYTFFVRVTDGTIHDTAIVRVTINDVNEAPSILTSSLAISAGSANGETVGTVNVDDPDTNDSIGYTVTGGTGSSLFALSESGLVTIVDGSNFTSGDNYTLIIQVADAGGLTDTETVTVNVTSTAVASNIPTDTLLGTDLSIMPTPGGALTDAGTADAITGLENLVGPYLGDAPDAGAQQQGLGEIWTGPRSFTDQLAYGLPQGWVVSSLEELSNFEDLGADSSVTEGRLLLTRSTPKAYLLVTFESHAGEDRWTRYEEILSGEAQDTEITGIKRFRDGLAGSLVERDGRLTMVGARVDYNGVLKIEGSADLASSLDIQNEMFTFIRSLYYGWDLNADDTPIPDHGITPVGDIPNASTANRTRAGVLHGDVTLTSASVIWDIEGDANENATASLQYRRSGTSAWQDGLDLHRIVHTATPKFSSIERSVNRLSGSLFRLAPGTSYEIKVTLNDPEGGNSTATTTLTTRSEPRNIAGATVSEVWNLEELLASTTDIVLLHAGDYGDFQVSRGGTEESPVTYRAYGDGDVNFSYIQVKADHVWLDDLNVIDKGFSGYLDAPEQIQVDVAITRGTVTNAKFTVAAFGEEWFISDNTLEGQGSTGQSLSTSEGIEFRGRGHVAAFNDIFEVYDGVSYGDGNIDVHNNAIHDNYDDSVEPDYGWDNYRVWQNSTWNGGGNGFSVQPINGGPWYFVQNQITGISYNPFKLRSGTGALYTVGNTIIFKSAVQSVDRLFRNESVFANNYIRVDADNGDNYIGYGYMPNPIETRLWDYNRYDVVPQKVFKMAGNQSLEELQASGIEIHTQLVGGDD